MLQEPKNKIQTKIVRANDFSSPKKIGSMEMSFFSSCPLTGDFSVPRKSGHTRNAYLTIIPHGGRCPDLLGPAGALRIGHDEKKDISML
jgi:hypothetical protein